MTGDGPEVAASCSGGSFSNHFPSPSYQDNGVATFLQKLGSQYSGPYKWVFSCELILTYPYFVICAALGAAVYPTSPRRRPTS